MSAGSSKAMLKFIFDPDAAVTHSFDDTYGTVGISGEKRPASEADDLILWGAFPPYR